MTSDGFIAFLARKRPDSPLWHNYAKEETRGLMKME